MPPARLQPVTDYRPIFLKGQLYIKEIKLIIIFQKPAKKFNFLDVPAFQNEVIFVVAATVLTFQGLQKCDWRYWILGSPL